MKQSSPDPNDNRPEDFGDKYYAAADAVKKTRPRPSLMNLIVIGCLGGLVLGTLGLTYAEQYEWFWNRLVAISFGGFAFVYVRHKGATRCPNCRRDFKRCPPEHCHVCGKHLKNRRCESCAVDWSWIGCLGNLSETVGNKQPIQFCPGCGILLNSDHTRLD